MTGKKSRPSGEEPEMTFEAPDTVPMETVEDEPRRRSRDLGTLAVGTVGFAASSTIDPDSTSAAMDDAGQPFDDSLDVFDTLQPEDAPDAMPTLQAPDPAVLSSIYGAQSTAGGGFNLTEPDPDLDFAPIDFTVADPDTAPLVDVTAGATSFASAGQPPLEAPDPPSFLHEPFDLDDDTADLDVIEEDPDDDDGDDDDLGG